MSLASTSIHRPVLTWVLSAFILLFGLIGLSQIGVREYPAIDPPTISVQANYTGANAGVVENEVTQPLETSLNGIDGIRSITSQSKEGQANITVEFNLGVNLEQAANDVRDRVSRAQKNLPATLDPPTVAKADANATAILVLTLQSDKRDLLDLSYQASKIQERLQTIAGVSSVAIYGERRYAMRIRVNPNKLYAYKLTLSDLQSALNAENVDLPAGSLEGASTMLSLRAETGLRTTEEFQNMILRTDGTKVIRLKDVAEVVLSAENERNILRINGKPQVGLAILPQPGANQIEIVDEVNKRIVRLSKELPPDLKIASAIDNTRFVRSALREVQSTIIIAFLLVVGVIFLFLRDWRTTLVPVITIPISLVGVFSIMWFMDFSINVLTMLGVVLAIGIVVDDAIVVLENIYAKIESGMPPREAAIKGIEEIFFAVISTTLVLVAVFTPLLFLSGFTGRLFREFGFVVAGSVLISGFVALTLAGMLASRLLKHHTQQNWFYRKTEPFFVGLSNFYEVHLEHFLKRPWIAIPVIMVAFGIAALSYVHVPEELAPMEDRSNITVNLTGPEGATYAWMDARVKQASDITMRLAPEAKVVMGRTAQGQGAYNTGAVRILLVPPEERQRTQAEIAQKLAGAISKVDGLKVTVIQDQTINVGGKGGLPIQVVIESTDLDTLHKSLPSLLSEIQQDSTFSMYDVDLKFTKPQLNVGIDRNRLRDLGVTPYDVGVALQLAFGEGRWGYFLKNGDQYQIIAALDSAARSSPDKLQELRVRNKTGQFISMSQLVTLNESAVPPQLYRFNRYVAATVSASLAPGHSLGEGLTRMQDLIHKKMGPAFHTDLIGTSRDFAESSGGIVIVFLLALLIVYLLLAAQFESFRYPFVIMLTVPLALAGALASLWMFDCTLNLFSKIGLVMLVGLVTKNGILIVEFANQRREAGLPIRHAVAEAAAARLRPILMTTLCMVLGILPIALATNSRQSMGVAVIGGMLSSLVLTLLVIPAIYTMVAKKEVHS